MTKLINTPVKTEQSLADSAFEKLRKANEAKQRATEKKVKPDSGFTPEKAGFSAQAWAALSLAARYNAITFWIEQRRAELKAKAEAAERAAAR